MKSLEELANWGTSDLPTLLTQVILAEVEEAARARRFGRNLVSINEDLVRTKGRSIIFYRRGTLTASSVSEGGTPQGATITYTPYTLTVSKYAVAAKITQEAIDGSNLDLIRDSITEAGIALADKEDSVILTALLGETTATVTTSGLAATLQPYVTGITSFVGQSKATINWYSGAVTLASLPATFTYKYTGRENILDAVTEGTFDYRDVVASANVVRGKKWEPDFMLIHPDEMHMLLKNSQFIDASKYGAREPLLRGEIGQISNMRVLVSTNMTAGSALIISSKRAAKLAIKRHVDLKRWDNPSTDSIELYFYMEYGATVTDEDAVCIVIGFGDTVLTP